MKPHPQPSARTGSQPGVHAEPPEAEIQKAAYYLWQSRGCPAGCDFELWLEAKELLRHRLATAATVTGPVPGIRTARASRQKAGPTPPPETIHFPPAHETIPAHSAVPGGDNAHLDFRHSR